MFRVMTRLVALAAVIAAVGATACSDDPATPAPTLEASSTGTAVADPLPQLTTGLGEALATETSADGGVVMRWRVDAPSAEGVASDLAARVAGIAGLTLTATEVTERGGIIAFEGVRSGHYLVTRSTGRGTPVELRLDPLPGPIAPPAGTAVPLPGAFPVVEVPIFPGAVVVAAKQTNLGDGLVRFDLTIESERASIEVLGYYADLFRAANWTVSAGAGVVEVHGTGRVTTVWVREVPGEASRTALEVVQRGRAGAP